MITTRQMIAYEFNKNKTVKLPDLYKLICDRMDNELSDKRKRHRIRATLDTLSRSNQIKRIGPSTWEKIVYEIS